jgi:hypothetical protein
VGTGFSPAVGERRREADRSLTKTTAETTFRRRSCEAALISSAIGSRANTSVRCDGRWPGSGGALEASSPAVNARDGAGIGAGGPAAAELFTCMPL